MSIRVREVDGRLVALCAARSIPKEGDIYLDDGVHYALMLKFSADHETGISDPEDAARREREESNNPNRDEWDATFGATECRRCGYAICRGAVLDAFGLCEECRPAPEAP